MLPREKKLLDFLKELVNVLTDDKLSMIIKVIETGGELISGEESKKFSKIYLAIKDDVKKAAKNGGYSREEVDKLTGIINDRFKDDAMKLIDYLVDPSRLAKETEAALSHGSEFAEKYVEIIYKHLGDIIDQVDWNTFFVKAIKQFEEALAEINKTTKHTDGIVTAMAPKIDDTYESVKRIESKLDTITPAASVPCVPSDRITKDMLDRHNKDYIDLYDKVLFLEDSIGDKKFLKLHHTFVMPLVRNYSDIEDELTDWMKEKEDPDSVDYALSDSPLMLLYGKAGIGKSSLTAKLINDKFFSKFDVDCYAIPLSKYAHKIKHSDPMAFINKIRQCFPEDRRIVLILDGLDELCVLQSGFNGSAFIYNLGSALEKNTKVLITSREGYFTEIEADSKIVVDTLYWNESSLEEWCRKYTKSGYHQESRGKWCDDLLDKYGDPNSWDENQKEVFCIPLILYMCCAAKVDINNKLDIAKIYDKTFEYVGIQAYLKGRKTDPTPKELRKIAIDRQYTKELAFIAFLNDKHIKSLSLKSDLIENAKKVTAAIMEMSNKEIKDSFKQYLGCYHFVSEKKEGIQFAHKTVAEYFAAVKIYEDHLSKTMTDDLDEAWQHIFEAFRYKQIDTDIFNYIKRISDIKGDFDSSKFGDHFENGMERHILMDMKHSEDNTYNYNKKNHHLPKQISTVFASLTEFLHLYNYVNDENKQGYKYIRYYIYKNNFYKYNFSKWSLKGCELCGADLVCAEIQAADLHGADMYRVNLHSANLEGADLHEAYLLSANLYGANLKDANLEGAFLRSAELSGVNLKSASSINNAVFTGAKYCLDPRCKTIFPDGFDPKSHGMIEVDYDGNPV